jgi:hypothetical protein
VIRRLAVVFAALSAAGCLPGDTRPDPGSVLTTVSGSAPTRDGFTSADGWTVTFDQVLLGAGPMQLGDDCQKYAEYSEPGYDRVLDLTQPPAQKLGIMFGLGICDIDFQLSPPSEDAVLGSGVTQADKDFMRTAGSDAYIANEGIALHVQGTAVEGSRTLGFDFDIRQSLFFLECSVVVDGVTEAGLNLRGGVDLTYNLLIETEGLFRDDWDRATAALRFAPFADADSRGDGNGTVTLEELALVPLAELQALGPYTGGEGSVGSLADYVYRVLWPTLLLYRDTGACRVSLYED